MTPLTGNEESNYSYSVAVCSSNYQFVGLCLNGTSRTNPDSLRGCNYLIRRDEIDRHPVRSTDQSYQTDLSAGDRVLILRSLRRSTTMAAPLLSEADIEEWLDEKSPADLVSALYQMLEPPAWADELCTPPAVPITTPAPKCSPSACKGHTSMPGPRPPSVPRKSAHFSSGRRRRAPTHCLRRGREMSSNATSRPCSPSRSRGRSTSHPSGTRSSLPELRRGASLCCASWPQGHAPASTSSRRSGASAPPSGPADPGAATCRRTRSPSWPSSASTELSSLPAPSASGNVFKQGPNGHLRRKMRRALGTVYRCLGCWARSACAVFGPARAFPQKRALGCAISAGRRAPLSQLDVSLPRSPTPAVG